MNDRFAWLDALPFAGGPPDLRIGTHALDISDWLPQDAQTAAELRLRVQLLDQHRDFVQMNAGYETALEELLSLVEIHIGDRLHRDRPTPLEQLAVSVPDDVLLMAQDRAGSERKWRLVGGTLLFPNHWTLSEKMGSEITEIHAPVEGYDELLAARVRKFFDRLSPARPVWRRNWFIHDDATLFQPAPRQSRAITDPAEAAKLWIRSEWQTLRRLAFSGLIVFTIKTQVAPLSALVLRERKAAQMVTFLESASTRALTNHGAHGRVEAILDVLRSGGGEW